MSSIQRGFTLIELMIVVVIIAILASIAYPSYQQFVRRSARADAKTALLENAQFLERNYTVANRYDQDSAGNAIDNSSLPVQHSPREDGTAKYDITIETDEDGRTYTLSATPASGSSMDGDDCGTLTLNNLGQKEVEGATLTETECWNR